MDPVQIYMPSFGPKSAISTSFWIVATASHTLSTILNTPTPFAYHLDDYPWSFGAGVLFPWIPSAFEFLVDDLLWT